MAGYGSGGYGGGQADYGQGGYGGGNEYMYFGYLHVCMYPVGVIVCLEG